MSRQILRKELLGYKKNIGINKNLYGGAYTEHYSKIKDITKHIDGVGSDDINNIYNFLTKFESNVDEYIKEIDQVDTSSIQKLDLLNEKIEPLNLELNKLNSNILEIINNGTLYFEPTDTNFIQNIKIDSYDKVLSMFKIVLHDYTKQLKILQNAEKNQIASLYAVYEEINNSLTVDIGFCEDLIIIINKTTDTINKNLQFDLGSYDDPDNHIEIVPSDQDIYNYTKRVNISNSNIELKQGRLDSIIEIAGSLLKSIKISEDFDKFDEEIDKTELTFGHIMMVGGFHNNNISIAMHNNFVKLSVLIDEINVKLKDFYDCLTRFKIHKVQYNNFIKFMLLITMQNKFSDKIIPYVYINKGLLQFYLTIIEKLLVDISATKTRPDTLYFFQHHYITLISMQKFCKFLIGNMKTLDVIDIQKCRGNISKSFVIFNYFKDILDSYNEIWEQNKISVYARINDWQDGTLDTTNLMFKTDKDDAKILIVNKDVCSGLDSNGITKIKFSEVFDSINFTSNNNITKYMTLETQLSQKKGVMLMTYGYSGTGKTFTLFGSGDKQGLLQATLNNIRGLDEVRFRVMELYGHGVQYPHYWKGNVSQHVIKYDLVATSNNINISGQPIEDTNVIEAFENTSDNFVTLKEVQIETTFKNFSGLISQLDQIRKSKGRIRMTANNPESSRSIVIYEFHLLVENEYVPFVIIDLPGREEIVETYANSYLSRSFIDPKFKTEFHKALLTSMSVNPLAISLLVPTMVIKTFNDLDNKDKNTILGLSKFTGEVLENENFSISDNVRQLKLLLQIKNGNIPLGRNFNYKAKLPGQPEIIQFPTGSTGKMLVSHHSQVDSDINNIQYQGVLAIFIINRCILMGMFDVLEKLYKNIANTYFKADESISTRAKKEALKTMLDDKKIDAMTDVSELYKEFANFTTYLAPFEGIYINENIMGLIKVLAKDVANKSDQYILNHLTSLQDKTLNFEKQKLDLRELNFELYKDDKYDDPNFEPYENIYRSIEKLQELQKSKYSSQKIYEYDEPFIKSVINVYTKERTVETEGKKIKLKEVLFFKLFYLFSNTQMTKKCKHQWKLLNETTSFINTINESK